MEAWKEKRGVDAHLSKVIGDHACILIGFGDCVFLLEGINLFKTCTQRQARQLKDMTKRCCPYKICDFSLKPTQRHPAHTTPLKHDTRD
ncbi:hypothetical protein EMCRGX_G016717 [Ephydatia muelleri]